jgi:23S rRNA (uracil1939-C5)-methyltransferase
VKKTKTDEMTEYKIERLGHHGDGIAEGPVYAPLTLPGEIVSGELVGSRLENVKVVEPSSDRVKAPCRHFRSCGGCQLQHASDSFVADWKTDVVRQALAAQGLEAEFHPIQTSSPMSRRRAVFSARRTKKGATVGFHARSSDVITEIPECQLLLPQLRDGIAALKELAIVGGSRKGEMSVTVAVSANGLDVAVTGGKLLDGPLQNLLAQETERHKLARLSWDGEVVAARHSASQSFGQAQVIPPAGAFLQATDEGEKALLAAVENAIEGAGRKGVDLFAGCGTFTLPLALRHEMHAVEGARPMMEALDQGWRKSQGLKRVTTETRDLFRNPVMAEDLDYDLAVVDPPRAGAAAQVKQLAMSAVPVIAFVSCNPVTFARDAKTLVEAGYELDWIQVVDQFRWSTHIELAARFSR